MHKPSWHVIRERERVLKVLQCDNSRRARDGTSDMSASRDSTTCPPSKLKLVLSCLFNCVNSRLRFGWTGALVGETEKPRWPKGRLLPSSPLTPPSFGVSLGGETKCNNFSGKRSLAGVMDTCDNNVNIYVDRNLRPKFHFKHFWDVFSFPSRFDPILNIKH